MTTQTLSPLTSVEPRTKLLSLTSEQFEQWQLEQQLQQRIREMSVAAIASGTFTCTACGEMAGYYVITTGNQTYHLPTRDAYSLLESMVA